MKRQAKSICAAIMLACPVFAGRALCGETTDAGAPSPGPQELVLETKGIVCTFCSFGAEKNLRKLPFIDGSKENGGVTTDINNWQMTVQAAPGKRIEFADVAEAVKKAGFGVSVIRIGLAGTLAGTEGAFRLIGESNGQEFVLSGGLPKGLAPGGRLNVTAHIDVDTADLPAMKKAGMYHVTVDSAEKPQ